MKLWHVTAAGNKNRIEAEGLVPRIGPRSEAAGETVPYVYLFESTNDMEDALINWLGDELEDEELILCEISLPDSIAQTLIREPDSFELRCPRVIPPEYIRIEPLE